MLATHHVEQAGTTQQLVAAPSLVAIRIAAAVVAHQQMDNACGRHRRQRRLGIPPGLGDQQFTFQQIQFGLRVLDRQEPALQVASDRDPGGLQKRGQHQRLRGCVAGDQAQVGIAAFGQQAAEHGAALGALQAFEDALPYADKKRVRDRIPVGVYDVIADFGQARGGNTATILPNEAYLARRYGRTILLRANIMRDPTLFAGTDTAWRSVIAPAHADDLTADATFHRTLWHEVGHYLGVDATADGRPLDDALGDTTDLLEEMKADLVSLFSARALRARGYYDDAALRAVYAAGVRRVLQNNRPRRDQPYGTMQLMQWNFFLEKGLLRFDAASGRLAIDYKRYHDVVAELLGRVLAVQRAGDKTAAGRFIDQYTRWDDALHGVVAQRIRDAQRYRYSLFRYAALGE